MKNKTLHRYSFTGCSYPSAGSWKGVKPKPRAKFMSINLYYLSSFFENVEYLSIISHFSEYIVWSTGNAANKIDTSISLTRFFLEPGLSGINAIHCPVRIRRRIGQ